MNKQQKEKQIDFIKFWPEIDRDFEQINAMGQKITKQKKIEKLYVCVCQPHENK